MKSCRGFTLILLGLFIQASSTANTTQMYYFELNIESSALDSFTRFLNTITELSVGTATVTNITITTECEFNICNCTANYIWSTDVCQMLPECCKKSCAAVLPGARCLYENKVLIDGSFTIENEDLSDTQEKYTTMLTSVYSTMKWFDFLHIKRLSSGSIIGDFVMQINGPFNVDDLINTTNELQGQMHAKISIVTTGFIKCVIAPDQIGYHTSANITCTTKVKLDSVNWYIQINGQKQQITNGTEATVYSDLLRSTVFLKKTSEVWKGTFICDYKSDNAKDIIHRASNYLDVALLPQIFITSYPQFPDCRANSKKITVNIMCIIDNNTETYIVHWLPETSPYMTIASQGNSTIYTNTLSINCTKHQEVYNVTCEFTNKRANNTASATLTIPVIYDNSTICPRDGVWPQAKANFNATLQCSSNEIGFATRSCTGSVNPGNWGLVNSQCVNTDLWNLLSEAQLPNYLNMYASVFNNKLQKLQKGCGLVPDNAYNLFGRLKMQTESQVINTFANINASVDVLFTLQNASEIQKSLFNKSMLSDFVKSSSNLLNSSLIQSWNVSQLDIKSSLAVKYLIALEGVAKNINVSMDKAQEEENVKLIICSKSSQACKDAFNVTFSNMPAETISQARIYNLPSVLPQYEDSDPSDFLLSVTDKNACQISINFPTLRLANRKMYCVYFDMTTKEWSEKGCTWGGALNPTMCQCEHCSSFTSLMSTTDEKIMYIDEITYVGLGFSICSLVLCLVIEFVVWNTVVKSNISHFRHTVLVNISLSLLMAHSIFLVSYLPNLAQSQWCLAFTIMKHFCFLAVFFWMLCMSMGLLHQMLFVFVQLRKKVYLGLCFFLGYICPLLIVICTVITYDSGEVDSYYLRKTCWLIYKSALNGSIHAFIIPVGIIVIVNLFIMVVVISRILKPTLSEGKSHDEKETVRSVIRTVVLLTPTLGITWIFGFLVLIIDLTRHPFADIANYAFTFFNSFQGFFILLTGCFGEKKVRDALRMRISSQHSEHYTNKRSMKMAAAVKKK